jgi:hypothetical protein
VPFLCKILRGLFDIMKNSITTIAAIIAEQSALNAQLIEAIDAEYVELMADALKKGANPNAILDKYGDYPFMQIVYWSNTADIEKAVALLLDYGFNPQLGLPKDGFFLTQLREQKANLEENKVKKTLTFTDEQTDERLKIIEVVEKLLLENKATPLTPVVGKAVPSVFRRGVKNPEKVHEAFYYNTVLNHASPTELRSTFDLRGLSSAESYNRYLNVRTGQKIHEIPEKRLWHFHRFGTSTTVLPDGGVVFIAGEHEDYYDNDFCIFNDVLHIDKDGKMHLYFYREADFMPTDFHSATFFEGNIVIIGNMGYQNERIEGKTPVYSLNLANFVIQEIETYGQNPKWLSGHSAMLIDGKITVWGGRIFSNNQLVDNDNFYALDPKTGEWVELT